MRRRPGPGWFPLAGIFTFGVAGLLILGGCGESETSRSDEPSVSEGGGRTYAPGHAEWDATVPESFPTPLPPDVEVRPLGPRQGPNFSVPAPPVQ